MMYVARVEIEALTPLKIGSSKVDMIVDMPVNRDWNGLPYIQGTSLAGILRKEFDEEKAKEIFGYEESGEDDGMGSSVIVSSALLVDENGEVYEGILKKKSDFLRFFETLPLREHTAINEKGTALEHSKFDEEVIYKGARFRFLLESQNKEHLMEVLEKLVRPHLRIGAASTRGFGRFKVVRAQFEEMGSERYASWSGSLNEALSNEYEFQEPKSRWIEYRLDLVPEETFFFGSGYEDEESDATVLVEPVIDYENREFKEGYVVIPASSVKGAIAQRTTFYYNALNGNYVEDGQYAERVEAIFGEKKDKGGKGAKGKILVGDCYVPPSEEKLFNHVKIDRFSGGAVDGALFNERVIYKRKFELRIYLDPSINDQKAIEAFERALSDVTKGMLPLGGRSLKGHGIFRGEIFKNGERMGDEV
jgi:CRISPR/Cas system CSM-associated protein Csm3 (group 7 of RAMP superfamily)